MGYRDLKRKRSPRPSGSNTVRLQHSHLNSEQNLRSLQASNDFERSSLHTLGGTFERGTILGPRNDVTELGEPIFNSQDGGEDRLEKKSNSYAQIRLNASHLEASPESKVAKN